ncbi:hypothetical protein AUP68_15779 [Ilyonectria robusta]
MMNSTTVHAKHEHKIARLENHQLSDLIPYGSLVITLSLLLIVLLSNILERWLLRLLYGKVWLDLERPENERRRRSFTYFHLGAITMFSLLCVGAYPVLSFIAGPAEFSTPISKKRSDITVGDVMFLFSEIYSAYYIFELCFRTRFASPISIAHHFGLLIITQTALSLFASPEPRSGAALEFYMCMVWGAFDVVVELPIYVSMIIWRIKRGNHQLLARLAFACSIWGAGAALIETSITIYLLKLSWEKWALVWRITTPIIFTLWITTQLYSASRLLQMGLSERSKQGGKEKLPSDDGESALSSSVRLNSAEPPESRG